jgi:hypothetical protein
LRSVYGSSGESVGGMCEGRAAGLVQTGRGFGVRLGSDREIRCSCAVRSFRERKRGTRCATGEVASERR